MGSAKPFCIAKREVWEAYKQVKTNQGAAGVDGQSIEEFDADLSNNLYRLWNRLSSGSYFPPPVLRVDIPKGDGGRGRWGSRRFPIGLPRRWSSDIWSRLWSRSSMTVPMGIVPGGRRTRHLPLRVSAAGDTTGCWTLMSRTSSILSTGSS